MQPYEPRLYHEHQEPHIWRFTGGNIHLFYQLLYQLLYQLATSYFLWFSLEVIFIFVLPIPKNWPHRTFYGFCRPRLGRALSRNGNMCKRNNFIRFEPRCQLLQGRLSPPTISLPSFTGKLLNSELSGKPHKISFYHLRNILEKRLLKHSHTFFELVSLYPLLLMHTFQPFSDICHPILMV